MNFSVCRVLKPLCYCFCQLKGGIDDCPCSVDTVDYFNNINVYPRLQTLMHLDFFRYYKVNFLRDCPFWVDDSKCSVRDCHVKSCPVDHVPEGIRSEDKQIFCDIRDSPPSTSNEELGRLDATLSESARQELLQWVAHDDVEALSYCDIGDNMENEAEFVDLLINPERFTGYRGPSAHRIWRSIYEENCFKPDNAVSNPFEALKNMCIEKRAFYRALSGLHTSINVHLCAGFLMTERAKALASLSANKVAWGPNLEEFRKRFDPDMTEGYGPQRLKNLYYLYLLELRALSKAAPYLARQQFYTGNKDEDESVRLSVRDLLRVLRSFPDPFDEKILFNDPTSGTVLREEFRQHFINITRIMDCVGCDKCKLWGKLQIQGLGTALKILFTPDDHFSPSRGHLKFRLRSLL
ncbi:unnamed protein product [Notodromas monacha]|uniref:Uncharacterized protein n=1 Tax=Notodromas monacha TaxID=399045 RepID=A0A7R9BTK4_9CRUS|nr:unnamed protein product [Notodromas monacha]CAG0919955.1 unnamed protein product [Notodromas monacha]